MFLKPEFFIIGERKCGTSSLYRYLIAHPNVLPCKQKEPQFFTKNPWYIWWNLKSYYALFPSQDSLDNITISWPELDVDGTLYQELLEFTRDANQTYITGEASANTFAQAQPRVIKYFLPEIKLILMLRNPVDRAFSHYRMLQRFAKEGRNVGKLKTFSIDAHREMEMLIKGKKGRIIGPGIYVHRLKNWMEIFGRENIFIIRTEDFDKPKKSKKIMRKLCVFLNLPEWDFLPVLQKRYNQAAKKEMPTDIREQLQWFYKPYNLALEDLLGRKMKWD